MVAALLIAWVAALAPPRPHPIELAVDPCVQAWLDVPAVVAVVELETTNLGNYHAIINVGCMADRPRAVALTSTRGERVSPPRIIEVAEIDPTVRARVVALAIVELAFEPDPARKPAPTPKAAPQPEPMPPRQPWQLSLGAALRWWVTTQALLGAGELSLTHHPHRWLGWRIALAGGGGRTSSALGTVHEATGSLAAFALAHATVGPTLVYVALGARGGVASLRGRARDPRSVREGVVRGPWLGPAVALGIDVQPRERLVFGLGLELGIAAVGTRARVAGEPGPGLAGLWVSPNLHAGTRF